MTSLMWLRFWAFLGSAVLIRGDGQCQSFTGGTCNVLDCSAARGPAVCTKVSFFRSECLCQPGFCSIGGKCVSQDIANTPVPTRAPPTYVPPLAPLPSSPGENPVCEQAYRIHKCWNTSSFLGCCHKCQSASFKQRCDWSYKMPCCPIATSYYYFGSDDVEPCTRACILLGDASNNYQDYCPGGKIAEAVKGCPAAQESYDDAIAKFTADHSGVDFCTDKHLFTCTWDYQYYDKFKTSNIIVHGDFSYSDPYHARACSDACSYLGESTNAPAYYCAGGQLEQSISNCPEALASLKQQQPAAAFCTADSEFVRIGGNYNITSKMNVRNQRHLSRVHSEVKAGDAPRAFDQVHNFTTLRSLESLSIISSRFQSEQLDFGVFTNCDDAFTKGKCWDQGPFKECCADCEKGSAKAKYSCDWEFEVNWANEEKAEQVTGHFEADPGTSLMDWKPCDDACNTLDGDDKPTKSDFCQQLIKGGKCENSPFLDKIASCPKAKASFIDACNTNPSWCAASLWTPPGMLSMPALVGFVGTDKILAVAVVALSLVAAAATVVKCRSRSLTNEAGYEPFMG